LQGRYLRAELLSLEKEYGNLQSSEARELKQLRDENTKLKRLVADLSLDKIMLQDIVHKKDSKARQTTTGHDVSGLLRSVSPASTIPSRSRSTTAGYEVGEGVREDLPSDARAAIRRSALVLRWKLEAVP
jgi:hypothetical protein